jgi:hypothetical protein
LNLEHFANVPLYTLFNVCPRVPWVLALKFNNELIAVQLEKLCGVGVVHHGKVALIFVLDVMFSMRSQIFNLYRCKNKTEKTQIQILRQGMKRPYQTLKRIGQVGEAQPKDVVCVDHQGLH